MSYIKSVTALCLLLASSALAFAKDKDEHRQYLESKTDEAAAACGKYLLATAKDPDSIKIEEKYTYGFGRVFTKNQIFVYFDGWGRNTYGAVLRHSFTCTVTCKKDQPCSVFSLTE